MKIAWLVIGLTIGYTLGHLSVADFNRKYEPTVAHYYDTKTKTSWDVIELVPIDNERR
jgi:hypothetical protein